MVSVGILVLIWIALYTGVAILISRKYDLENSNWNISGPFLSIRSQFGLDTVRSLASRHKRAWSIWGTIGVIFAIISGILGFIFVSISVFGLISQPDAVGIQGPTDLLVIPGVNRFLPLAAAPELLIALLIAMIIHEGGHAIYCALGDIKINSTGVIFGALIPIGAFVEPNEEQQNEAKIRDQLKMYAAGVMNNYAMFAVTIVLTFFLVSTIVAPVAGVAVGSVLGESPAERAGLESGDVVTEINGESVEQPSEIRNISESVAIETVTTSDGETHQVPDGAFVTRASQLSNVNTGKTVTQLDGENINSPLELSQTLEQYESSKATLTYQDGTTTEIRVGVYMTARDSTGLADSFNMNSGDSILIDSVGGDKVNTPEQLESALQNSGDEVQITYWDSNGDKSNITYTANDDYSSVVFSEATSGVTSSNLGIDVFPKDRFYSVFNPDSTLTSIGSSVYTAMILPIASLIPVFGYGLPGFTPFIQNFYTITIGGAMLEPFMFFFISVLFWSAWININLAIFNCLPTFALDGGHILKAMVWSAPVDLSDKTEKYIILFLQSIALIPLLMLAFVPLLL